MEDVVNDIGLAVNFCVILWVLVRALRDLVGNWLLEM
jgi:hypothetical protein